MCVSVVVSWEYCGSARAFTPSYKNCFQSLHFNFCLIGSLTTNNNFSLLTCERVCSKNTWQWVACADENDWRRFLDYTIYMPPHSFLLNQSSSGVLGGTSGPGGPRKSGLLVDPMLSIWGQQIIIGEDTNL